MFYDELNEKHIVTAALMFTVVLPRVVELDEDDLYFEKYRIIFKIIKAMYSRGEEIGLNSVRNELVTHGNLDQIDETVFYDNSLIYNSIFGIDQVIQKIREDSQKRKLHTLFSQGLDLCRNKINTSEDIMYTVNQEFKQINSSWKKRHAVYGDNGFGPDRFVQRDHIETGITAIDGNIIGLFPTQFITIGARPGLGKTSLAISIGWNAVMSQNEKKVLFFSLEMETSEIEMRLLSMNARIDSKKIQQGRLETSDFEKFITAEKDLMVHGSRLFIYDDVFNLEDIKNECKKQAYENSISLIIIDYLQLMKCRDGNNRYEKVSEISRELKLLAKELRVPVIALAQLNRLAEDEEPKLSHLRESGSIEQDSNIVIFIHKDEKGYNLIIAKNRNGKVGKKSINFISEYTLFTDSVKAFNECYNIVPSDLEAIA